MNQNLQPGDLCTIVRSTYIRPECLKFVGRTVILLRITEPPARCKRGIAHSLYPFWKCAGLPDHIVSHMNLRKVPPAPLALRDAELDAIGVTK
jgi:hypothetical protein